MPTVAQEPAGGRRRLPTGSSRFPPRRRLAGALIGLIILPLLTLGMNIVARGRLNLASEMLLYLIAVVVVGLIGGLLPGLAAAAAAVALLTYFFIQPVDTFSIANPDNVVALVSFLVAAVVSSAVGLAARRRQQAESIAAAIAKSREELRVLAEEQAALRRLATLVAQGVPPAEVFAAVAHEVGSVFGADATGIARLHPDDEATVVARVGDLPGVLPLGSRWKPEAGLPLEVALRTGRPARRDDFDEGFGTVDHTVHGLGIRSVVAAPIVVEGRLWGTIGILGRHEHFPPGTEQRMAGFTQLLGTAVANADSRAQLTASRARIVVAADDARRRIERDLHDGTQQRLVSLCLELRLAQADVPAELPGLRRQIGQAAEELNGAVEELREIARGIHPDQHRQARPRLARADRGVEERDRRLRVSIRDDGVGGADLAGGSGLLGLGDRVHALDGSLDVDSRPGRGTAIVAELPMQPDRLPGAEIPVSRDAPDG
jgi:signal transduction histidine kinase